VIDRLYMQGGDRPNELVLTADGETLITANAGSNTVSFLDPRSLFETDRIEVDNAPGSLLLDPPQQRVYVFNRLSDTISVLDVRGRRKVLTAATDAVPVRGAFDRLGTTLYVIHDASPYLRLFEPDLTTRERIFVGIGATAIAVDPRTGRIYLARRGSGTVDVYDPISLLPIDSIPTRDDVAFLAIDGELNRLAMLERQRGVVRLIKLANREPVAEIEVGEDPYWVSFVGER
jgi:YVTN family beta-propeller protein